MENEERLSFRLNDVAIDIKQENGLSPIPKPLIRP
jgi:hypothetical protein